MLKSFIFLLRFYLFWLIFFAIERLVFLGYFYDRINQVPLSHTVRAFFYGLRLDASMAGYVSIIPLLVFIVLLFFPMWRFKASITKTYVIFLVVLFSLLTIINFNIYREWGTKLNAKALDFFFGSTQEALASGASSPLLLSVISLLLLILTGVLLSRYIINYKHPHEPKSVWLKMLAALLFVGLTVLSIRGGLDASPINQSMAYYSNRPVLNHAAINTEWNLIHDLINQKFSNKNPYKYYSNEEAAKIVKELYSEIPDTSAAKILNISKPNIVLILLESFTADIIESLGGEKGVAPNMEKHISEGLLFDHIYASGDRTDKGLIAVLSAFPTQATRSIIKFNDKQEKLPSISLTLKANGYATSFYYGGQSEFFNIKSYLLSHGINTLKDKASFDKKDISSWGAFDHKVFEMNAADLDQAQEPFFSTILTLSNHEPFQLPGKPHFPGEESESKFRSTAFYTDSSLAAYLKVAKTKRWYKNTMFVIVADHGHRLPKSVYDIHHPGRFRIPLILYGGALKPEFKGRVIRKVGNQTDIAATLLNQLNVRHNEFKWSRDLLNPATPGFSFFSWDNGFGLAHEKQILSLDNVSKKVIYRKNLGNVASDSTMLRYGKAYMQTVYQRFLDY